MSNEPNQPMETLLRESAKKRAAEAGEPFELHPVNRRALQDEVVRNFTPAKPTGVKPGWAELLMALLPRLALGVGIFVVLGVTVYLTLPQPSNRGQSFELSKLEPDAAREQRRATLNQVAERPLVESMSAEKASLADRAAAAPAATPSALGGGQETERSEFSSKAKSVAASDAKTVSERDANFFFQDKTAPALRPRTLTPELAAGAVVSKDTTKEVARADTSNRRLDVEKPAPQPALVSPPAPTLAGAGQIRVLPESAKKAPESLALKVDAPKSESVPIDQLSRQKNASAAPSGKQLVESKVAMNATARFQEAQLPVATDEKLMALAGSVSPSTKADAQVDRFDFVQQDSRALYRRNLQSPPLPKVLTRFTVRVDDGRVVLTDVDGSIYSGSVMAGGATGGVRFQASGTRGGQKVTIDGTLDAAPAKAQLAAQSESPTKTGRLTGPRATDADDAAAGQKLRARVTVAGTQFEIQAVRVSSQP